MNFSWADDVENEEQKDNEREGNGQGWTVVSSKNRRKHRDSRGSTRSRPSSAREGKDVVQTGDDKVNTFTRTPTAFESDHALLTA